MPKKTIAIVFVMLLLTTSFSVLVNADINIDEDLTAEEIESLDYQEEIGEKIYESLIRIYGNDSGFKFCGPAYVNSTGMGLHLGRSFRYLMIRIPVRIGSLISFIRFPRPMLQQAFIYSNYFYDENAVTEITPIGGNETIKLKGNHSVFAGVYTFNGPYRARKDTNKILKKFFDTSIDFPVLDINGRMFWYFNLTSNTGNEILDAIMPGIKLVVFLGLVYAWALLWPFQIKSQFIGFVKPLEWYGYTPFVIWRE